MQHGYAQSPLEAIAFELQNRFERMLPLGFVDENVATARDADACGGRNQSTDGY